MNRVYYKLILILLSALVLMQINCTATNENKSNAQPPLVSESETPNAATPEKTEIIPDKTQAAPSDSPFSSPTPTKEDSPNNGNLIGLVDNSDFKYLDGCGCSLSSFEDLKRNRFYLLRSSFDKTQQKKAWMNIDGETTQLDLVNSTRPQQEKNGVEFTENYKKGDITVKVNYIVGQEDLPGGEVTNYSAIITATKNGRTETVKTRGDCGC